MIYPRNAYQYFTGGNFTGQNMNINISALEAGIDSVSSRRWRVSSQTIPLQHSDGVPLDQTDLPLVWRLPNPSLQGNFSYIVDRISVQGYYEATEPVLITYSGPGGSRVITLPATNTAIDPGPTEISSTVLPGDLITNTSPTITITCAGTFSLLTLLLETVLRSDRFRGVSIPGDGSPVLQAGDSNPASADYWNNTITQLQTQATRAATENITSLVGTGGGLQSWTVFTRTDMVETTPSESAFLVVPLQGDTRITGIYAIVEYETPSVSGDQWAVEFGINNTANTVLVTPTVGTSTSIGTSTTLVARAGCVPTTDRTELIVANLGPTPIKQITVWTRYST